MTTTITTTATTDTGTTTTIRTRSGRWLSVALLLLPSNAPAELTDISRADSRIWATTYRAGMLGFLGHDHAILAPKYVARLNYDSEHPVQSTIQLEIPVASLEIDSPEARQVAGLTGKGPSDADVAKIREQMLGPKILHAEQFPVIRFQSRSIQPTESGSTLRVSGELTIRGNARPVSVNVIVGSTSSGAATFNGALKFKLSEFGIEPPSGNTFVKVKDEMELAFRIVTRTQTQFAVFRNMGR